MINALNDIRHYFIDQLESENFTVSRDGSKTIELLSASFKADEPAIFGKPNQKYIDAELAWYFSESTNINTLGTLYGKKPAAWEYSANAFGEINSNYGKLVFSKKYFNQFKNAIDELVWNPDSRRAIMVYNRPSIWTEYDEDGKNDFICTNAQTFYIRNDALHMVSQMRSNDAVFGYKNDYAWAKQLMEIAVNNYNMRCATSCEIVVGDLYWQVQNLHCYERHFDLVRDHYND
jgi:thymidylate synthase